MSNLSDTQMDELCSFAGRLADTARKIIVPYFRSNLSIEDKPVDSATGQPVTIADQQSENAIRDLITSQYPSHGIIGEEFEDHNPDAEFCWVLDPIDGTRAFIAGLPMFGTLIGLGYQGQPLLGVVDQPIMKDRFIGTARGSFLNGDAIKTRKCDRLDRAVYAVTDPRMMATPAQEVVFQRLMRETHLTQFGGNCCAYAMLASGSIDLITENDLKPWDIFALIPVIEGAGGIVTSWTGSPAQKSATVVACGDPSLHKDVLPILKMAS